MEMSCDKIKAYLYFNVRNVITLFLEIYYSRTDFVYLKRHKRIIAVFVNVDLYKHIL